MEKGGLFPLIAYITSLRSFCSVSEASNVDPSEPEERFGVGSAQHVLKRVGQGGKGLGGYEGGELRKRRRPV